MLLVVAIMEVDVMIGMVVASGVSRRSSVVSTIQGACL